jgi:SAM-dependent methyltransferase
VEHKRPERQDYASEWDTRYAKQEQVWSGNPNGALVAEARTLSAGRALDVGCGEGADAIWLALQGWDVTALDVSQVALERGVAAAEQAGVAVQWLWSGLLEAGLAPGLFDLVSAQYPALLRTPDNDAERALIAAVSPGGTLLVVHHAEFDVEDAAAHGCDVIKYVSVDDVHAMLGNGWTVQVYERRPSDRVTGAGAHHTEDLVLRARRTSPTA